MSTDTPVRIPNGTTVTVTFGKSDDLVTGMVIEHCPAQSGYKVLVGPVPYGFSYDEVTRAPWWAQRWYFPTWVVLIVLASLAWNVVRASPWMSGG